MCVREKERKRVCAKERERGIYQESREIIVELAQTLYYYSCLSYLPEGPLSVPKCWSDLFIESHILIVKWFSQPESVISSVVTAVQVLVQALVLVLVHPQ